MEEVIACLGKLRLVGAYALVGSVKRKNTIIKFWMKPSLKKVLANGLTVRLVLPKPGYFFPVLRNSDDTLWFGDHGATQANGRRKDHLL